MTPSWRHRRGDTVVATACKVRGDAGPESRRRAQKPNRISLPDQPRLKRPKKGMALGCNPLRLVSLAVQQPQVWMDIVEQSAKRKLICPRRRNCRHASCRMSLRTNFGVVMGGEMVRRRRRSQKEYKHTAAYRESNRRPFPLYSTDFFRSKAPGFALK